MRRSLFNLPRRLASFQVPSAKGNVFRMSSSSGESTASAASLSSDPLFQSLFKGNEELNRLKQLFEKYGYPIRFAGGPVRDLLQGKVPNDLDFATTATPDEMKELFEKENVRTINALGEKHGTITARINDKVNYEITTLRIDKVTDGRRAEVEYTKDWGVDANRRDLTINSMFLDLEGNLYDFFDGRKDLEKHRVAFVGNAETRIQEDYLRILRYFRFYGRIAQEADRHDAETIEAIRKNVGGMKIISGERIWMEWKKILTGKFPEHLTLKMTEVGLGPYIGLPENPNTERFLETFEYNHESLQSDEKLHYMTLLSSLLNSTEEMMTLHNRLKMSGFERDLGLFVISHRNLLHNDDSVCGKLRPFKDLIVDTKSKQDHARDWACETLKFRREPELARELKTWDIPKFPVTGHHLKDAGCPPGKLMSVVLTELRSAWKKSDFQMSPEELMDKLSDIVKNLDMSKVPSKSKKQRKNSS